MRLTKRSSAFPQNVPSTRAPKARRRNFFAAFIDVVGWTVGSSFFAAQTVLQEFLTHLTQSNLVIGLTTSVVWSANGFTPLLVSNYVERLPVKKWYVMVIATFERVAILGLVVLTPLLATRHPTAMVAALMILMAAHFGVMGCSIPAYSALISKVVPARQRGILYGLGGTVANVMQMGTGLLIPVILTSTAWWGGFPNGYTVCFAVGFIVLTLTYIPLAFVDEPPDVHARPKATTKEYARELWTVLREHRDFRHFIISGWFYSFGLSGTALYLTYAIRVLGAPSGESGWFTVLIAVGSSSSVLWGLLADRKNNRLVLLIAAALLIVAPIWALEAKSLAWFYPVVFLTALGGRAAELSGYNMQMEFSPPTEVPRYVAMSFVGLFLPRLLAPLTVGALADRFGYRTVFAFVAASSLLALLTLFRMRDPREAHRHSDDHRVV